MFASAADGTEAHGYTRGRSPASAPKRRNQVYRFTAGWSNWQLARFWPWNSRFESLPGSYEGLTSGNPALSRPVRISTSLERPRIDRCHCMAESPGAAQTDPRWRGSDRPEVAREVLELVHTTGHVRAGGQQPARVFEIVRASDAQGPRHAAVVQIEHCEFAVVD